MQSAVSLRTRLLHAPYGDQALFAQRSALQAVGGVPRWALLEDVGLTDRLRALSRPAIVPAPVVTSGRLYATAGFWQVVATHQVVLLLRAAGVQPDELSTLREKLLSGSSRRRGATFTIL